MNNNLYTIECKQGSPLSSWGDLRTEQEIIETFWQYMVDENEDVEDIHNIPVYFNFDYIKEHWDVEINDASDLYYNSDSMILEKFIIDNLNPDKIDDDGDLRFYFNERCYEMHKTHDSKNNKYIVIFSDVTHIDDKYVVNHSLMKIMLNKYEQNKNK